MARVTGLLPGLLFVRSLVLCATIKAYHGGARRESTTGGTMMADISGPFACEPENQLVFSAVSYSNLGGLGPDDNLPAIQLTDVMPYSGKAIDLRITNVTEYTAKDASQNAIVDNIVNVNVMGSTDVVLQFQFLDAATQEPTEVGPVILTMLDFDQKNSDGEGKETATIMDDALLIGKPVLSENTEISVSSDGLSFSSTQRGVGSDNPTSLFSLTEEQKNRALATAMHSVSVFQLRLSVEDYTSGRNFMFGGATNLNCDKNYSVAPDGKRLQSSAQASNDEWRTLYAKGYDGDYVTDAAQFYAKGYDGDYVTDAAQFNNIFQAETFGIVRRECRGCTCSHKDVYFKRKTNPQTWDAYDGLLVTWRGDVGFHTDFDIYSSIEDALTEKNPWQYCNGNVSGIGFPRDCAPVNRVGWQWNSLTKGGQAEYRFSVYRGGVLLQQEARPASSGSLRGAP